MKSPGAGDSFFLAVKSDFLEGDDCVGGFVSALIDCAVRPLANFFQPLIVAQLFHLDIFKRVHFTLKINEKLDNKMNKENVWEKVSI